jgi:hypothetical protein
LSAFASESSGPGVAATTVLSAAIEVTAGDCTGLGKVTAASFDPPETDPPETGFASADDDDLPLSPLSLPGDGSFGLVVREAARSAADAAGGVALEGDDLPEPEVEDSDRGLSRRCAASADLEEEPKASAAVRSEDLSLPSGASPFLLSDSGLGSTLFRTTVSG